MATMTPTPRVNVVPLMVGALDAPELQVFHSKHFLNQLPPTSRRCRFRARSGRIA